MDVLNYCDQWWSRKGMGGVLGKRWQTMANNGKEFAAVVVETFFNISAVTVFHCETKCSRVLIYWAVYQSVPLRTPE